MKLHKIITAYSEMEKLAGNINLSDQSQWELFKLRKLMRQHVEFHTEREEAIKEKYIKFADDKGNIYGDKLDGYINETTELNNMDVEFDFVKPVVPHAGINFLTMEKLEDFIDFT